MDEKVPLVVSAPFYLKLWSMDQLSQQEKQRNVQLNPKQKWSHQNNLIQRLNENRHDSLFCNVARFSPDGNLLAATDEAKISLLKFQKQFT